MACKRNKETHQSYTEIKENEQFISIHKKMKSRTTLHNPSFNKPSVSTTAFFKTESLLLSAYNQIRCVCRLLCFSSCDLSGVDPTETHEMMPVIESTPTSSTIRDKGMSTLASPAIVPSAIVTSTVLPPLVKRPGSDSIRLFLRRYVTFFANLSGQ